MEVAKFFEIWEKTTIALSDAECGRLIRALVEKSHKAKNDSATMPKVLIGREKAVYPFLCAEVIEKTANEMGA